MAIVLQQQKMPEYHYHYSTTANGNGTIRVEVLDDKNVKRVWIDVYTPSYQPPEPSESLVKDVLPGAVLNDQGNDTFGVTYTGFDEPGTYRLVIHAEDNEGYEAIPVSVEVTSSNQSTTPKPTATSEITPTPTATAVATPTPTATAVATPTPTATTSPAPERAVYLPLIRR